jgi:hypothetical protein
VGGQDDVEAPRVTAIDGEPTGTASKTLLISRQQGPGPGPLCTGSCNPHRLGAPADRSDASDVRRRMPSFNPHRAQRQTAIHDGDTAVEKYDGVARPVHTVRVVLMQLPALAATSRRLLECAALPLCFATCAAT